MPTRSHQFDDHAAGEPCLVDHLHAAHTLHGVGAQGRGGFWVIKTPHVKTRCLPFCRVWPSNPKSRPAAGGAAGSGPSSGTHQWLPGGEAASAQAAAIVAA